MFIYIQNQGLLKDFLYKDKHLPEIIIYNKIHNSYKKNPKKNFKIQYSHKAIKKMEFAFLEKKKNMILQRAKSKNLLIYNKFFKL